MISFETATAKAADFLKRQGIYLVSLKQVEHTTDKWVVTYEELFSFAPKPQTYVVEMAEENGELIGFQRT